MGVQIFPIINGQECRGSGDGKSLVKIYMALRMEGVFSGNSDNIMRVDFRTGKLIQDNTDSQENDTGMNGMTEIITDDRNLKRNDYEAGLDASSRFLSFLKNKGNEQRILKLDGVDLDYLAGAIEELENIIREITRAKKFNLPYNLWISV